MVRLPSSRHRTAAVLCLSAALLAGCGAHKDAQARPQPTTTTSTSTTTSTTMPAPTTTAKPTIKHQKKKHKKPTVHSSFTILPPLPAGSTTTTTLP
jgi:hypothetical protein